ncbi:MAG: hypothetical protein KAI43_01940 [Candidatus Aureabacteria bacterium]|nr:hypothetical protein [Candidatus Auribacterota bacterium]
MSKRAVVIIILFIFLSIDAAIPAYAATNKEVIYNFEIKLSIEEREKYKGVVIGKLYFIKMEITNLTDKKYHIGKYFRTLMTLDESNWSQFSMAASGPTNLNLDDISYLKYGYGANSIAQKGEDKQSIVIHIGNMNDIIHDSSPKSQKIALEKWWPEYLLPKSSVTITWPTFWFTDSADKPQFMTTPSFSFDQEKYYCWVNFINNETREIVVTAENLLKILSNTSEPLGLRAASIIWLLEDDIKNEKSLLPYITNKQTPKALAFRAIQALMVWGSPEIIDDVFSLWKERKILPFLDKDMKDYFTWSSHNKTKEYNKKVEIGNR